jgi:hypothetical protein
MMLGKLRVMNKKVVLKSKVRMLVCTFTKKSVGQMNAN